LSACEVNALRTTLGVGAGNDLSGANSGCTTCTGTTCSAGAGSATGLQTGIFTGDAAIGNAADLAWMKNVVELTGNFNMSSSLLTNVNGLGNLKTVDKDMTITSDG